MSVIDDIAFLRNSGFWPANIIPDWALTASSRLGVPVNDPAVLMEGLFPEALKLRTDNEVIAARLLATQTRAANEMVAVAGKLRFRKFSEQEPPVGVVLGLMSTNASGVGLWRANNTLNLLASQPPGVTAFEQWISLTALFQGRT